MKLAKFFVSLAIFLTGGVLIVRLILVVAAPHLLQIASSKQLRAAGFTGARVERAWVDIEGVHFAGIALDETGDMSANEALIPMSRELIGGTGIGRVVVSGLKVAGLPRIAAGPAGTEFAWPDYAIELRDAQWRPTPDVVVDLTVVTQAAGSDGSARIAATGTARHTDDVPALVPLQLTAALVAHGDTLAGRVRLTDARKILDLRVDGEYRVLSGLGTASIVGGPATLSASQGLAEIAPALARALGGRERLPIGTLETEAHLDWDGKTLLTSGRVDLTDMAFVRDGSDVERITGSLDLSSLWPPKLALSQGLRVLGRGPDSAGHPLEVDAATLRQMEQVIRDWFGLARAQARP